MIEAEFDAQDAIIVCQLPGLPLRTQWALLGFAIKNADRNAAKVSTLFELD